jgi:hypothetical protein
LGKSPSPPSTPPPIDNIFDIAVLNSSPSDMQYMQHANNVLKEKFRSDTSLNSPEKNYVMRLGRKAEQYKARIAVLEKQKKHAEDVLSKRKRAESGVRKFLKGQHLVTLENIYENVRDHEKVVESRKKKTGKNTSKNITDGDNMELEDEQHIEVPDSSMI